ncbi:2-hydroxychromene-2-carboxylate isomerase [Ramlibacter henchirensis]|uniref:2-hydroxychromene-2-carboxylate isomerase n=1 Tax=Ramlibacter henchirensis TaxID=204072 RepID=A0A4Z0C9Z2_9BURK|nr:2-hydroxychromene-2-carboxylate isomerase [Ramlibacter henchirensis]TFZ07220.1 2-hydroxychromene-2-carboxylate isomerase [Ramlibacter henchirensis]
MKRITFWLDFISPYAYLAFEHLPQALEGLSYEVEYRPVLFAGLLKHHGQLGPAEIAGKREWTYRQVLWQAHVLGIPMQMPAVHPFNPLALLRLALAHGPNRHACETLFRHVWRGGADASDPARLEALRQQLAPVRDPASDEVKHALRQSTDDAIAAGLFGVPTFAVDDKLFWGFDALPMLRGYLQGDPWFEQPWREAARAAAASPIKRVRG